MTDRVLLISPDGMLGRAWAERLATHNVPHETVGYPQLDLTKASTLDAVDWSSYGAVINCSGWTDVDGAETREADATAVNGEGVGLLAQRCADAGASLVHYSTDYVFDGTSETPYATDHVRSPINAYGRSKAVGELAIEASGASHLIVRTSWLYAPWGGNFVRTMARLGAERESLRVVDDQRGRPTSAEHLASVSMALLAGPTRGTVHVTDGGECSWCGFARAIVADVNPSCVVDPCTTAEFPRPAPRPAFSVLDISKTEAVAGPMPHWTENLSAVMAAMKRETAP